jgi:hypothetical protein
MSHLIHPAIARAQAAEIALAADRHQHVAGTRIPGRRTMPRRAAVALLRRQAVHTG